VEYYVDNRSQELENQVKYNKENADKIRVYKAEYMLLKIKKKEK
jgi:hypothetical protein